MKPLISIGPASKHLIGAAVSASVRDSCASNVRFTNAGARGDKREPKLDSINSFVIAAMVVLSMGSFYLLWAKLTLSWPF
jgi:hypothetical protein